MATKTILTFAEQREGRLKKASREVVSEGRRLADLLGAPLKAVLLGSGVEALAAELSRHGAEEVILADDPALLHYSPEGYTWALAAAARQEDPATFLLPATAMGRDLAPRVAAALEAGLASDCTGLSLEGGRLVARRPVFAGKALATVAWPGEGLQVASLRPNVFPVAERIGAPPPVVHRLETAGLAQRIRAQVVEMAATGEGRKDVAEAEIIVSGGRGLKGPEHFPLLQELADKLGGALGASRAAVDAGWIGHQHQVGQTGKTVSPQLYFACGISGAIQHLAGMSSSKTIVAINKDPEAPIFKVANYGIVGDLFEIVPLLIEELARYRE
jgi:electron transfer flavoprotein alpha subunit